MALKFKIDDARVADAVGRKQCGKYNCAQSVACAFADAADVSEDVLYRMAGAFGTGMGCLEGTCGALVGAGMVISAVSADRVAAMKRMRAVMEAFTLKNGASVCKELKGISTGTALRSCPGCVEDASALLASVLEDC